MLADISSRFAMDMTGMIRRQSLELMTAAHHETRGDECHGVGLSLPGSFSSPPLPQVALEDSWYLSL